MSKVDPAPQAQEAPPAAPKAEPAESAEAADKGALADEAPVESVKGKAVVEGGGLDGVEEEEESGDEEDEGEGEPESTSDEEIAMIDDGPEVPEAPEPPPPPNTTGPLEHIERDDEGVITHRSTLLEGKLNGPSASYDPEGKVLLKSTYKAGKLDGPVEFYAEDGVTLTQRAHFKSGKLDGDVQLFDEKGQLFMTHCRSYWGRGCTTHVVQGGHFWNQANANYAPFIIAEPPGEFPGYRNFLLASARYDHGAGGAGDGRSPGGATRVLDHAERANHQLTIEVDLDG